ncbi:MAG: phage baseplate assembly protein V [Acinetobacter sp.]|nr:phage baseplate assembly protein V [Acinetobacter sp.]
MTHDFTATFHFGIISQCDAQLHYAKVKLPHLDDFETDWLPMHTANAGANQFYNLPDVGELVAVILDHRGEQGYILGAVYNEQDPTPTQNADLWVKKFSNGTIISHDRSTGNVQVQTSGKVSIVAEQVVIQGNVNINGSLQATGDVVAQGKSLVNHTHRGDSGGTTSSPN